MILCAGLYTKRVVPLMESAEQVYKVHWLSCQTRVNRRVDGASPFCFEGVKMF